MTTEYASAPESAKLLKAALRAAFPATKFSVKLSRGTGYGNCYVSWTDGPTMQRVTPICGLYEGQGFDGSTDSTIYYRTKLPDGRQTGLHMILEERDISASLARRAVAQVAEYWGIPPVEIDEYVSKYTKENCWQIKFTSANDDFDMQRKTGHSWSTLIYQAASDRTRYARTLQES